MKRLVVVALAVLLALVAWAAPARACGYPATVVARFYSAPVVEKVVVEQVQVLQPVVVEQVKVQRVEVQKVQVARVRQIDVLRVRVRAR